MLIWCCLDEAAMEAINNGKTYSSDTTGKGANLDLARDALGFSDWIDEKLEVDPEKHALWGWAKQSMRTDGVPSSNQIPNGTTLVCLDLPDEDILVMRQDMIQLVLSGAYISSDPADEAVFARWLDAHNLDFSDMLDPSCKKDHIEKAQSIVRISWERIFSLDELDPWLWDKSPTTKTMLAAFREIHPEYLVDAI